MLCIEAVKLGLGMWAVLNRFCLCLFDRLNMVSMTLPCPLKQRPRAEMS